jgi:hypothetical protein
MNLNKIGATLRKVHPFVNIIDLHKYETKRTEFKDWSPQFLKSGERYWVNLKTLETTHQHPGELYYEVNLK